MPFKLNISILNTPRAVTFNLIIVINLTVGFMSDSLKEFQTTYNFILIQKPIIAQLRFVYID